MQSFRLAEVQLLPKPVSGIVEEKQARFCVQVVDESCCTIGADMNCPEIFRKPGFLRIPLDIRPHWHRPGKIAIEYCHIMAELRESGGVFPPDSRLASPVWRKVVA